MKDAPHRLLGGSVVLGLLVLLLLPVTASAIDEFPVAAGSGPSGITVGPDGALWFSEENGNRIGRMTTDGVLTNEYPLPTSNSQPAEVVPGPDGRLWFTQPGANRIGAITTGGAVQEYSQGLSAGMPDGIAVGPDGRLWFTEPGTDEIGAINTTGGTPAEYSLPSGSDPADITLGADGRLWFTEPGTDKIGAITTAGTVTEYSGLPGGTEPSGITPGPGGTLWFTGHGIDWIYSITTGGTITPRGSTAAGPGAIAVGPDDALWFTTFDDPLGGGTGASNIGRITTLGSVTHTPLPSGSEPSGLTPGPAGRREIWFTQKGANKIGRIALPPPFVPPPPPGPAGQAPSASKPKPARCVVPRLRGSTVKQAKRKLKRAKCRYRIIGRGRVTKTSPRAGTRTTKTVKVKAARRLRRPGKSTASPGGLHQ